MSLISPSRETLTVEFKSDRKRLPDSELVEAVIGLANTEGGTLWLGVEDDGTSTGPHPDHLLLDSLGGLVAARTSPSLTITVPKAHSEIATRSGVYLRRRLKHDGTPKTPRCCRTSASQLGVRGPVERKVGLRGQFEWPKINWPG